MDFADVVRRRRMVRNFTDEPVTPEVIDNIIDLARRGPSAGYSQGQAFIVVTKAETKQAIADVCNEATYIESGFAPWISRAPVLIIPCTSEAVYRERYAEPDKGSTPRDEQNWPVPYWVMDIGCAVMTILLAAVDAGLAAGYAGSRDLDALRAVLNIPADFAPVGVIPIGHPAPDKRSPSLQRGRRSIDDVVHREGW